MDRQSLRSLASIAATALMVVCAVAVTGVVLRRELWPTARASTVSIFETFPEWRLYTEDGRRVGPSDAPAVMVVFADYQCPACKELEGRLRETRERFPSQLVIVFRHFPLPIHRFARRAAEATECAAAQNRFESMHALLYDRQDSIGVTPWRSLAHDARIADVNAFDRCMRDSTGLPAVTRDFKAAQRLEAKGTPTVLINGVRFSGVIPQSTLDSLVANAIKEARQ
jgi:protein-disulfide isomerase